MNIRLELDNAQEKHREVLKLINEIEQEKMRLIVMGCELQGRIALLQELLAKEE